MENEAQALAVGLQILVNHGANEACCHGSERLFVSGGESFWVPKNQAETLVSLGFKRVPRDPDDNEETWDEWVWG